MTTHDALLAAILTFPEDDTPRLVMADYLDENGEPERAEFCRVQVELERSKRPCPQGEANAAVGYPRPHSCFMCSGNGGFIYDYDCDEKELRRRERELLKLCWTPFFRHLFPEPHGIEVGGLEMRWKGIEAATSRGFIASLTLPWQDWLSHHGRLYWSPEQTVECPSGCVESGLSYDREYVERRGYGLALRKCTTCNQTGRIPRPFVATAQPLESVQLTSLEGTWNLPDNNTFVSVDSGNRFTREKCPTCDGRGMTAPSSPCHCEGEPPLNSWTCPAWPRLRFAMPETNPIRDVGTAVRRLREVMGRTVPTVSAEDV